MRFPPLVAVFGALALLSATFTSVSAQQLEKRIALVVGEGAYANSALPAAANDAGLVAQTLQAAGFDVVGARDMETQGLRDALREFVEKARNSGPDTVAMIYFAGYGLQSDGENYLAGVDARIDGAGDVPMNAIRVADFVKPLAALQIKQRIVVLDAARKNPFVATGQPLAGGLAMMQPDDGSLVAFNAAPGTIGPEEPGPYGVYAKALVEMIKAGGAPINEMFERVRMRVSEATQGAVIPWSASRISAPFVFFARTADAPADQRDQFSQLTSKPIGSFSSAHDAYEAAVAQDTLESYEAFLVAFPNDPMAPRVRAIVAARRESTIWRSSCSAGTPQGYWTYLKRYPRGPHVYEARRALTHLAVAVEPPPVYDEMVYDVPLPPPDEIVYVERPVVYLADPYWAFPPPPPPPLIYFGPAPVWFADYPPPPPPIAAFVLPIPVYYPVAAWVAPPSYVAPAPVNVFAANIHNTVVVNQVANTVTVTNAAGQSLPALPVNAAAPAAGGLNPGVAAATGAGAVHPGIAAAAAALPAAAALRAARPLAVAPHNPLPGAPAANAPFAPGNRPVGLTPPAARVPNVVSPRLTPQGAAAAPAGQANRLMQAPPHVGAAGRTAPNFVAPRPGPQFTAPRQTPHFAAPPQHFAPRPPAPHFSAPHPAPNFAAPRPAAPHFAGPAPAAPHFAAPRPGPAFQGVASPRPAPHFAAPQRQAPGGGGQGKQQHWPPQH
jgi:uncharacterized caspase-like protein